MTISVFFVTFVIFSEWNCLYRTIYMRQERLKLIHVTVTLHTGGTLTDNISSNPTVYAMSVPRVPDHEASGFLIYTN